MDTRSSQPNNMSKITSSILAGVGVAILSLLAGTVLDYIIVQILSQFFLSSCSEDCYFTYLNFIFVLVVLISITIGIRRGLQTYRRISEKS